MEELVGLNLRIDTMHKDLLAKFESCPKMEELDLLASRMNNQLTLSDLEEAVSDKASKQSVASALHRKANRGEIEELVAEKADVEEIRIIVDNLEKKADFTLIEQMYTQIEDKVTRSEFNQKILPEIDSKMTHADLELFKKYVDEIKGDMESSMFQLREATDTIGI